MKRKKKVFSTKKGTSNPDMKASAMILEMASDYIMMGETQEERQNALNTACTAWNLSLLPEDARKQRLIRYIHEVKLANPGIEEDDLKGIQYNVDLLINEKIRLFPNAHKRMLNAEIVVVDGKATVTVLSTDT